MRARSCTHLQASDPRRAGQIMHTLQMSDRDERVLQMCVTPQCAHPAAAASSPTVSSKELGRSHPCNCSHLVLQADVVQTAPAVRGLWDGRWRVSCKPAPRWGHSWTTARPRCAARVAGGRAVNTVRLCRKEGVRERGREGERGGERERERERVNRRVLCTTPVVLRLAGKAGACPPSPLHLRPERAAGSVHRQAVVHSALCMRAAG